MCPACVASAAMVVGSVISTGGVTALVAKVVSGRSRAKSGAENEWRAAEEFQFPQIQTTKGKGE